MTPIDGHSGRMTNDIPKITLNNGVEMIRCSFSLDRSTGNQIALRQIVGTPDQSYCVVPEATWQASPASPTPKPSAAIRGGGGWRGSADEPRAAPYVTPPGGLIQSGSPAR